MRILLHIVALGLLAAVLAVGGAGWWFARAIHAPGPLEAEAVVVIAPGANVAQTLAREGVTRDYMLTRLAARATGVGRRLRAGEYAFPARVSIMGALEIAAAGRAVQRSITVPEGLTTHQVLALVATEPGLTGDVLGGVGEGALLPETYSYTRGEDRAAVVGRMRAAMDAALAQAWAARDPAAPLASPQEALILASIVEKETSVASEYARVAGVFANRLKRGMPLQTDPSVIYALTGGVPQGGGHGPLGRRLLRKDLKVDSPYNTYLYPGLPPGPIASPGRAAIEAAVRPEAHDYLYFVADGSGGHVFARTLSEHNANVAHWRAVRPR